MPFSFTTKVDGVDQVMASHVNDLQTAVNSQLTTKGAYASRPTAGTDGRLYLPTDKPVICLDNGSTWDEWDLSSGSKLTLPASGSFSWDNQGAASISTVNGCDVLTSPTGSVIRGRYVAASNPMFVKARIAPSTIVGGNSTIGVYVGDGTKIVAFEALTTFGGGGMRTAKWTNASTFSATYTNHPTVFYGIVPTWVGLQDDGTNIHFWMSGNGTDWIRIESRARLDFLASVSRVGWFISNQSGSTGAAVLYSWEKS